jgi:GNAT superfamily N-acetyltransferase
MDVRRAESEGDLEAVRRLFRSFLTWHHERHTEDRHLVDAYFDGAAWEAELSGLPGDYGAPDGCLLLCEESGVALGTVAFRRLDAASCEMKRMFVAPVARAHGAGRALADKLVEQARSAGYQRMYLDTSVRQAEAMGLYRSLGFVETEAYHDVPEELSDWLVFFRLDL